MKKATDGEYRKLTMTNAEVADVLEQGRDVILTDGHYKGRFFWPGSGAYVPSQNRLTRPEGSPVCLVGSLHVAAEDGMVVELLSSILVHEVNRRARAEGKPTGWATAWQWNDDHNTTASDVTDLMMSVAKDVRDGPVTKFILDESPPLKVTLS